MQPPAGARSPAPARRRAWLAVAGVVVLAAVAGSWMLGGNDRPQPHRTAPLSAGLVERPVEDGPTAATIIEEPAPATATAEPAGLGAMAGEGMVVDTPFSNTSAAGVTGATTAATDMTAPAAAAPALPEGNPFASAPAVATTPAAPAKARTAPAASQRTAKTDEPDLLAVLLGNIRTSEGKARDTEGLDALIQSMQAEQGRTAGRSPAGATPTDQTNGRPLRTRSEQIQSNLRECPPPNTAKGIKCRQDICAVYAGRDPACPAAG